MDIIEFFKARCRLCKVGGCNECPLDEKVPDEEAITYCDVLDSIISLDDFSQKQYEKAVEIVEKLAEENPEPLPRTIKDDFLERMPLSEKDGLDAPYSCAKRLGYVDSCHWVNDDRFDCEKCWQLPYSESNYAKLDNDK